MSMLSRNNNIDDHDYFSKRLRKLVTRGGLFGNMIMLSKASLTQQVTLLNRIIKPIRAPVPDNNPETLSSSSAKERISKVVHTFECWREVEAISAVASETTGTLKAILIREWPHFVRWFSFFSENLESLEFEFQLNDTVKERRLRAQLMLITCAEVLCKACCVTDLRRTIQSDANILQIVITLFFKQDARLMMMLEIDGDVTCAMHSPTQALSSVSIRYIQPHLREPGVVLSPEWEEKFRMLQSHGRAVVNIVLWHLSLAASSSMTNRLYRKVQKIQEALLLFQILVESDAFRKHLRKPKTIRSIVSSLHVIVSSMDGREYYGSNRIGEGHPFPEICSLGIEAGLGILGILFTSDSYANDNICASLKAGVVATYAALTQQHSDDPALLHEERLLKYVRYALIQFSRYSQYRAVVYKLAGAMESALTHTKTPQLRQNELLGDCWTGLRSFALERAIARYLFDKAQARNCHRCSFCGRLDRDTKVCGACKTVRYCSKTCQHDSWKSGHKFQCVGFRPTVPKNTEGEAAVRNRDAAFQQVLAGKDALRHMAAIRKLIRERYSELLTEQTLIKIDYTMSDFQPTLTLSKPPPEIAGSLEARWIPAMEKPKTKLIYIQALLSSGKTVRGMTFPISDIPFDFDRVYATCKEPYSEEHPFKRSALRLSDGTLLRAQQDEIDEILLQFWLLTKENPQWSLWKRVKRAVREVERLTAHRGTDIYDGWLSFFFL